MCTHTHVLCPLNCVEISRIQFRIINFSHIPLSQECFNGDIELQSCCQRFLPNSLLGTLLLIYFFFFLNFITKKEKLKDEGWLQYCVLTHANTSQPRVCTRPLTLEPPSHPSRLSQPLFGFRVTQQVPTGWLAYTIGCVFPGSTRPTLSVLPSPHCSLQVGSSVVFLDCICMG